VGESLSLLFVCECSGACSFFQKCLERENCRLAVARNAETAARTLLFPGAIGAVLLHDDGVVRVNTMASGLKLLSPSTPVVLISDRWPSEGWMTSEIDALYYTTSMSHSAARDIADFLRGLLVERRTGASAQHTTAAVRFVPGRPIYIN
jgi:hypothetical protein